MLSKQQRMKIKERGRYTAINPDLISADEKTQENSADYTDGFYSSESDAFVPDESPGAAEESQMQ